MTGVTVSSGGHVTTNGGDITVGGGSNPLTDPLTADLGMSMIDAKWVASKGTGTRGGDVSVRVKVVKNDTLTTAWTQVGLLMDGGTAATQNTQLVTDNSGNINIIAESDVGDSVDGSAGVGIALIEQRDDKSFYVTLTDGQEFKIDLPIAKMSGFFGGGGGGGGANELSDLEDVVIVDAADLDILQYNASTSKWTSTAGVFDGGTY